MDNVASKNDVANSVSVAEPSPVVEVITISPLLPEDAMFGKPAFDVVADAFNNALVTVDSAVCSDTVWLTPVLDAIDGAVVDAIEGVVASVAVVDTVSVNSLEDVVVFDAVVVEIVAGVATTVVVVDVVSVTGVEDVVVINGVVVDVVVGVIASVAESGAAGVVVLEPVVGGIYLTTSIRKWAVAVVYITA